MVVNAENSPPIKLSLIHFDEPIPDLENKVTRCFYCGKKISAKDAFVYVQSVSILCPDCTEYFNSFNSIFRGAVIGNGNLYDFQLDPELEEILNLKRSGNVSAFLITLLVIAGIVVVLCAAALTVSIIKDLFDD